MPKPWPQRVATSKERRRSYCSSSLLNVDCAAHFYNMDAHALTCIAITASLAGDTRLTLPPVCLTLAGPEKVRTMTHRQHVPQKLYKGRFEMHPGQRHACSYARRHGQKPPKTLTPTIHPRRAHQQFNTRPHQTLHGIIRRNAHPPLGLSGSSRTREEK